jgi:membrane-associated protein
MYVDIIALVGQYGYAALFFTLWLGIVGLPIPDEVIVMTGGLVVSLGLLNTIPAFIITYLGVVSGLMIGYGLGRFMGVSALKWLNRRKKLEKYLEKSYMLVNKYGAFSLCISYFIPVVRHIVPYVVGIGKMSFARYCLCSFSAGFIWTLLFFTLGRLFGNHIDYIGRLIETYGLYTLPTIALVGVLFWVTVRIKKKKHITTP